MVMVAELGLRATASSEVVNSTNKFSSFSKMESLTIVILVHWPFVPGWNVNSTVSGLKSEISSWKKKVQIKTTTFSNKILQ